MKASFQQAEIKNPALCARLFFVDKMIEISNLDLIRDLKRD
jgi:hypothetical protein